MTPSPSNGLQNNFTQSGGTHCHRQWHSTLIGQIRLMLASHWLTAVPGHEQTTWWHNHADHCPLIVPHAADGGVIGNIAEKQSDKWGYRDTPPALFSWSKSVLIIYLFYFECREVVGVKSWHVLMRIVIAINHSSY